MGQLPCKTIPEILEDIGVVKIDNSVRVYKRQTFLEKVKDFILW